MVSGSKLTRKRYTAADVENLIGFLAEPERRLMDRDSIEVYSSLGPQGPHGWSRSHKAHGWRYLSSTIEGREARIDAVVRRAARAESRQKLVPSSPLRHGYEFVDDSEDGIDELADAGYFSPDSVPTVQTRKVGPIGQSSRLHTATDQADIRIMAERYNLDSSVVRMAVAKTGGSILRAQEKLEELFGSGAVSAPEEEWSESQDEEQAAPPAHRPKVVVPKSQSAKPQSKRGPTKPAPPKFVPVVQQAMKRKQYEVSLEAAHPAKKRHANEGVPNKPNPIGRKGSGRHR